MTDDLHQGGEPAPGPLLRESRGSVLLATINRPRKGNSLNRDVISALDDLAADVEASFATTGWPRAVVVTGAGEKAFCAGADVTELDGITPDAARAQMRRGQRVFTRLQQLPVLVIAAVHGFAVGGGLELAMAADIRIAGRSARLGQPEITLGNIPGWAGTQRLPRLIGRGHALELVLTGELIDADRAAALGLVNRVVDDAVGESLALAELVASRSAVAVAAAKRAVQVGLDSGQDAGEIVEADGVAECCGTDEQRAAVQAFLNRHAR